MMNKINSLAYVPKLLYNLYLITHPLLQPSQIMHYLNICRLFLTHSDLELEPGNATSPTKLNPTGISFMKSSPSFFSIL